VDAIDGIIIDDLDSALQAYAELGDATTLDVRLKTRYPMAGLHVHLRAVTLAASLGALLVADGCSCSDRPLGDDPQGFAACLWLISPRGTRADGTRPIIDAKEHHRDWANGKPPGFTCHE
jgi:hypothetical protein